MSSIEIEVEIPTHYRDINVSVTDVIYALGSDVGADSIRGWLTFLNRHYAVFSRTPDAIIAEMTPGQRETIAKAFREQADRFDEGGRTLGEPPYNIEVASQNVENWMLANGVEELNGLALRDKLGRETRRLDWMFSASGDQLNALDQWDRDNIDDAMDREGAE